MQCNYNVLCRCGCDLPKSECPNYVLTTGADPGGGALGGPQNFKKREKRCAHA